MFTNKKLDGYGIITKQLCKSSGFPSIKAYFDGKHLDGFVSVDVTQAKVTYADFAASVMHGGYREASFKPTEFKLVDTNKNELLGAWGDEFQ